MKKTKGSKPHDLLFSEVFSRKESAVSFIRHFAPEKLVEKLELNSLELQPTSYVKSKLKRSIADLVFRCKYGKKEAEVCIIKEHKSRPPGDPHFQLLEYILEKWRQEKKQKRSRTPVICILLYHGKQKWKHRPMAAYIPGMDDTLEPYNPLFDYILVDLADYSDDFILGVETLFLVNALLLLKHSRETEYVRQNFETVFVHAEHYSTSPDGMQFINAMFVYLEKTTELSKEKIVEIAVKSPKLKDTIMQGYTLLDWAKEEAQIEGRAEGRTEGIKLGREKGREEERNRIEYLFILRAWQKKMAPELIAHLGDIPLEKVKRTMVELEAGKKKNE